MLFPIGQSALWSGFLVFLRVGAAMALLPAFGEQTVPARVRLVLAIMFTLVIMPGIAPALPPQPSGLDFVPILLSETLAGLFFGLGLRLFVLALQIAGTIAAQSTSLSQIFGGTAGADPQPAMGHLLLWGGLALATMFGLHVRLAEYLLTSYDLVPPGEAVPAALVAEAGLREIGHCFALGFTLAAPFVIASLVYNVTLGVINRAMPQLMVAFVGAPAITAGGLVLLALAAPVMLAVWVEQLGDFLVNPFGGGR